MPRKTQRLASRRTDHQGIPQIPSPLSASPREPSARTRVLSPACNDPRRRRGCAGGCSHAVPGPGRSQGGGRSHLSARGGRSDYRRSAAADVRRPAEALSLGPTPLVDRIASRVMSVSDTPPSAPQCGSGQALALEHLHGGLLPRARKWRKMRRWPIQSPLAVRSISRDARPSSRVEAAGSGRQWPAVSRRRAPTS